MRRLLGSACVAGACVVTVTAVPAGATGEITVSRDGGVFTRTLHGPLLDPALRWNPGMSRSTEVVVRNGSGQDAVMVIRSESDGAGALATSDDLMTSVRQDGGPWLDVPRAGGTSTALRVRAGAQSRLRLRVALDRRSTNQTQRDRVRLRFDIEAAQDLGGPGTGRPPVAFDAPTAGRLPATGAPAEPVALLAALAAALIAVGRRLARREDRHA